jgi:LETM1 and EF-hand domain-containing protein 1
MARYININAFGTDAFLRHQIENRLKYLKSDDFLISKEGIESLTLPEIQQICQSRGIRTVGVSPARLKSELNQWLELHLKHNIPSSLLILSRAFTISEKIPSSTDEALTGSAAALQATLSSLPDQVVNEAQLKVAETSGTATYEQKLNVIKEQEELIADELKQEAVCFC